MYERCLIHIGVDKSMGAALVAHHQDDVDENRLAELGKGNILNIDGMTVSSQMLGIEVIRPLLFARKQQFIDFADCADVCYMRDSTPLWSTRGWTRRTIDSLYFACEVRHLRFLALLQAAGEHSNALGDALSASLRTWRSEAITRWSLNIEPKEKALTSKGTKSSKKAAGNDARGSRGSGQTRSSAAADDTTTTCVQMDLPEVDKSSTNVMVLRLGYVVDTAPRFEQQIHALCNDVTEIAEIWNASIDTQLAKSPAEIARELCASLDHSTRANDGEDDADENNGSPGVCHLRKIVVHNGGLDAASFYFSRAVYSAINGSQDVQDVLRGQPVSLRGLAHIWESIGRARQEYLWYKPNKHCCGLYLVESRCLVLCSGEGLAGQLADPRWQLAFARAALSRALSEKQQQQ